MIPVLIADTDLGFSAALAVALEPRYAVETVSTVTDGVQYLARETPALAVIGSAFIDADPSSLLRVVQTRVPRCSLMLMVAPGVEADIRQLLCSPLVRLYRKPVDFADVFDDLTAILGDGEDRGRRPALRCASVTRVIEYVARHCERGLTRADVAHDVGISVSSLAHNFPDAIGMTFKEFVTRVRLVVARQLLRQTDASLEDIADRLDFADASHLSRVFHRCTGQWPGQYRESTGRQTRRGRSHEPSP